jgi:DNA-damage-inducible protein D
MSTNQDDDARGGSGSGGSDEHARDRDRALLPFDGSAGGESADRLIRRQWHDGRWFFSVVDVVAVLTDSDTPRRYWSDLKRKLHAEGFEPYDKIVPLKMRSLDGKNRETDAADVETMLRIIQSIPSPRAEPVKQWLARVGTERLDAITESRDLLAGMSEDQRRLFLRGQLADRNSALSEAAASAGVVTSRDFALFQDWGYRGLYNGETARDIAARKGLARGQAILDWMGPEELVDNLFRALQAEAKIRRDEVQAKAAANATHYAVGRKVRETIAELGGTMPEDLPTPAQSIQQLRRAEQKRLDGERQPPLFPDADDPASE